MKKLSNHSIHLSDSSTAAAFPIILYLLICFILNCFHIKKFYSHFILHVSVSLQWRFYFNILQSFDISRINTKLMPFYDLNIKEWILYGAISTFSSAFILQNNLIIPLQAITFISLQAIIKNYCILRNVSKNC